MHKLITVLFSFFILNSSFATYLLPSDYEDSFTFYKVEKEVKRGKTMYYFSECRGDMSQSDCNIIFNEYGYSKMELNSIERTEAQIGALILSAEIVTGGILWKRLMKFTLTGTFRVVQKVSGWSEGVANGSVALAVAAPTTAVGTYYVMKKAENLLNIVDPYERYKRSELVDTDEYEESNIINLSYDTYDSFNTLQDLLMSVDR